MFPLCRHGDNMMRLHLEVTDAETLNCGRGCRHVNVYIALRKCDNWSCTCCTSASISQTKCILSSFFLFVEILGFWPQVVSNSSSSVLSIHPTCF